ncbi:hypothetical protein EON63_08795 [archaeon]|nr:MAG: hypothetical protein EON63_08795 [archaeon]
MYAYCLITRQRRTHRWVKLTIQHIHHIPYTIHHTPYTMRHVQQVISILLEQAGLGGLAERIVFVAGHKVTSDPVAIPFSMVCVCVCTCVLPFLPIWEC